MDKLNNCLTQVRQDFGSPHFPELAGTSKDKETWELDTKYIELQILASIADSLEKINVWGIK